MKTTLRSLLAMALLTVFSADVLACDPLVSRLLDRDTRLQARDAKVQTKLAGAVLRAQVFGTAPREIVVPQVMPSIRLVPVVGSYGIGSVVPRSSYQERIEKTETTTTTKKSSSVQQTPPLPVPVQLK